MILIFPNWSDGSLRVSVSEKCKCRETCYSKTPLNNTNEPVKFNMVLQSDTDPGSDVPPAGILEGRCNGRSLEY